MALENNESYMAISFSWLIPVEILKIYKNHLQLAIPRLEYYAGIDLCAFVINYRFWEHLIDAIVRYIAFILYPRFQLKCWTIVGEILQEN